MNPDQIKVNCQQINDVFVTLCLERKKSVEFKSIFTRFNVFACNKNHNCIILGHETIKCTNIIFFVILLMWKLMLCSVD